jgi:hypothetical protein
MENSLENDVVDAVQFVWQGEEGNLVEVILPNPDDKLQRILRNVVRMTRWMDIRRVALHIATREGYASDAMTFRYPNPGAPVGTPYTDFTGVYLVDAGNQAVHIEEAAFDRLIARMLRTAIDGAMKDNLFVTVETWWQPLLDHTKVIAERT